MTPKPRAPEPEIEDHWQFHADGYVDTRTGQKVSLPVYALCKNKRRFAEFLDFLFDAQAGRRQTFTERNQISLETSRYC